MRKLLTGLVTVVLVAAVAVSSAIAATAVKPRKGMNLVGVVTDGVNPIAGAVVSDGVNVVATDEKGVYQMRTDSARFVFVSIPSDCKIPMDGGYPCFYKEIALDGQKVVQRDFLLERQPVDSVFSLVAMADIQLQNQKDLDMLKLDVLDDFSFAVSELSGPVIGFTLGDNVWDNMPMYEQFKEAMRQVDIPIFPVIGNHDHDLRHPVDYQADHEFKNNFGPSYYSFNRGGVHIVALDNILYSGRKNYKEGFTQEQLDWLKKDLEFVPKDKLVVIGYHAPTTRYWGKTPFVNAQEFYALLEGRKVELLAGHLHSNHTKIISPDVTEHALAAFMGAFWTGDLCPDGSPRGFGVYRFDGNRLVDSYYQGHCHPRSYQMYLYKPGLAIREKYADGIMANVFNASDGWVVEASEDGRQWQPMKNIVEVDPRAYNHMHGKDKPLYRKYAEPRMKNVHMYYYKPVSGNWSKITVRATDTHGNVYTETIANR